MPILKTKNLTYLYSAGTPFETYAIKDVSIDIEQGKIVALIGHTGSGKSTLIQHLNGLLKGNSGNVYLEEKDIWENKGEIRGVRFKVGLCFQYPEYQIFEEDVFKEIAFGPKQMGLAVDEIKKRVVRSLEFVGLEKEYLKKSPFDLSGGEKRRVAIASILAMEPEVLVLDEPTAGLDPKGREMIVKLIKDYQRLMKTTIVIVSHSMEDVARLADKVIVMNNGTIMTSGTVSEVYSHSQELKRVGLNIPQVTEVFLGLKERGIDCNTNIFTVEQGREEILRLLSKGGKIND